MHEIADPRWKCPMHAWLQPMHAQIESTSLRSAFAGIVGSQMRARVIAHASACPRAITASHSCG